jgi:hypothetical protein
LPLAQIRPPCDSTIDLLIAKLMPLPCGFVVKNASNIWSALPGGSPGPVSFTEISVPCGLRPQSPPRALQRCFALCARPISRECETRLCVFYQRHTAR